MTAPDPATRARELLDGIGPGTSKDARATAAVAEAVLALADAVRGWGSRVDRPRWDDDLRGQCEATAPHPNGFLSCDFRAGHIGRHHNPDGATWTKPVPDVTFDHPITVAGTPAEQRHREEKP